MKIAVSGLFFPFTMMEYFIRALERRNDVELFLVGPYFGNYIPWNGGMFLNDCYVRNLDISLPSAFAQQTIPFRTIENKVPDDVDLWIQVDAGWHFADRPKASISAHILTDPHVLRNKYDSVAGVNDFTFCMQTPYMKQGEIYLPYGYDPTVHFPVEVDKEYDACLVGLLYEHRKGLIDQLRKKGRSVFYGIGEILDAYRIRYSKTKVALNWSSLDDLPARVWEAHAMRIPLVSNRITDQSSFFVSGDHYLEFTNLQSGVDAVEYLLENYEQAQVMADAAYRKVISQQHTWDDRVNQILETVRLI